MAAMRRGLVHVLAWSLATGAAVALSWWGVHSVMTGTVYDPPRALPITAGDATPPEAKPLATSAEGAEPSNSPSSKAPQSPEPTPTSSRPLGASPSASSSGTSSAQVKSYDTEGGRAVFALGKASATLVSATPVSGWSMQVWKTETWIRVEFSSGVDRLTVFCTWHDSAPQ